MTLLGSGISSAVVMQGPIGAKVSKLFPSQLPAFQVRHPSRRNVDQARVAEDRFAPILALHVFGRPFDDERQFGLVHKDPGFGQLRQSDGVARSDDGPGFFMNMLRARGSRCACSQ